MSSVKCRTPMDVKLHWARSVKRNYNRMEPFPIGEIYATHIVSNLQVWATIICSAFGKRTNREPRLNQVVKLRIDIGYQFW